MKGLTLLSILAIALSSCTKEQSTTFEFSSTAATFSSSIDTRASGEEWSAGDAVGIMVTSNNAIVAEYRYNNKYNVSFTDPTEGYFSADSYADHIYYSVDDADKINFYAYYPYSESLVEADENYQINIADQTSPESLDFMEASTNGSGGYNKNSDTVALTFNHKMAKITMTLSAGTGLSLTDISAVTLAGFYTTTTYDFVTNTFGVFGGSDLDLTPLSEGNDTYSAILIPENAASHMVYFTTPHGDVPLDLSSFELTSGLCYDLAVKVSQTVATVSNSTIGNWVDGSDATFETD